MSVHERAGQLAQASDLANIPRLVSEYYTCAPKAPVSFGTSGHRGSSLKGSFNEGHIAAICQALVEHRQAQGITGPLYLGMDTHALSESAFITAVQVLAANQVKVVVQQGRGYTPTPVISHAILTHNKDKPRDLADGIVITPSHNPPEDGGFKYNPPNGGPADNLRYQHQAGQRQGRSQLCLYDPGQGRQNPHGLLQPLRHGGAYQTQRSVRYRHRQ